MIRGRHRVRSRLVPFQTLPSVCPFLCCTPACMRHASALFTVYSQRFFLCHYFRFLIVWTIECVVVFSFRMVFFYRVTTGWIFYISLCESSINSINQSICALLQVFIVLISFLLAIFILFLFFMLSRWNFVDVSLIFFFLSSRPHTYRIGNVFHWV